MSRDIIIYPNRNLTGATDQPFISFSGLSAGTISLVVEDDGSITFDGDTGSLFGISDNKDGLLHSVNDVSGLPIFQVYDDDRLLMGKWDEPTLIISGQTFNILGGQNHMMLGGVTGSTIMGGKNITGSTSDMTYVPQLNIETLGGGTSVNVLGIDSSGNVVDTPLSGTSYWTQTSGGTSIFYGSSNNMDGQNTESIIAGGTDHDMQGNRSGIFAGRDGHISWGTTYCTIIGGYTNNLLSGVNYASIINGSGTSIDLSPFSTIVGSTNSFISGNTATGKGNTLLGGINLEMTVSSHDNSSLIAGADNTIWLASYSTIIGGWNNTISDAYSSHILGGQNHIIDDYGNTPDLSVIIGGDGNVISGVTRSVIIGGLNITGTTSDTVYVPNLNIGTVGGGTPLFNLGVDSGGNVVTGTTGGGGGDFLPLTGGTMTGDIHMSTTTSLQFDGGGTESIDYTTSKGVVVKGTSKGVTLNTGTNILKLGTLAAAPLLLSGGSNTMGISTTSGNVLYMDDGTNQGSLQFTSELTANRNWQLPNQTGTVALTSDITITGLTTTGTSGPSTLGSGILNVPEYSGPFIGNTSGDCITDLYVSNIHGCSPITFHDSINFNGSIVDSGITNSLIFGDSHVLTGSTGTHGVSFDANVLLGGDNNKITPLQVGLYNAIIGGSGNEIGGGSRVEGNAIIGSADSTIGGVFITGAGSTIFGGGSHLITSNMSTIAGGSGHSIINGTQSATIGGVGNLLDGVDRSVILGGSGITGTTDDTVYVPILNINNIVSGGTSVNNLGIDASGNVVTGTAGGGGTDTVSATTTQIDFTAPKIFYKYTNQATGNISEDLTGAKLGITQKIYHNDASEPTYPAGWVLMGDGIYFTSQLNIIYCEWSEGSRVEYWYVQEQ